MDKKPPRRELRRPLQRKGLPAVAGPVQRLREPVQEERPNLRPGASASGSDSGSISHQC